ncbi:MAG: vancomycin resistance protein, partial [Lachnospiraceae bacterium]|nr:vancomycin resistance protein [Lachnospiraceae bacterium]
MKNKWKKLTALLLTALCCLSGFTPVQASAINTADYSPVFDSNYYYNTYADLQQNIGNDPAALLNHFVTIGMKEGRNGNALFNVKAYMNNNLDLLPVYG